MHDVYDLSLAFFIDEKVRTVEKFKNLFPFFSDKADWKSGKVSGTVYHGSDELTKLMSEVSFLFIA